MAARIYQPAKTAMQSGRAKTKSWVLDYEPEEPRVVESLMGWTSSADMKSQICLSFDTKEEAIAYCRRPWHSARCSSRSRRAPVLRRQFRLIRAPGHCGLTVAPLTGVGANSVMPAPGVARTVARCRSSVTGAPAEAVATEAAGCSC